MKFTRDGSIWLVLFIGGLAGFLAGHFELMTKAFPSLGAAWQARIELIAAIAGFAGAYLRMSPAALSSDHRLATPEASQTLTATGQLPKAGAILLACVLAGALPACATNPPPGTYSDATLKVFNADVLMKDLTAFSETVIALNAASGALHVNDADTVCIRNFTLGAAAGLQAYATGSSTLAIIASSYHTLLGQLSEETKLNDRVRFYLALIDGALSNVH